MECRLRYWCLVLEETLLAKRLSWWKHRTVEGFVEYWKCRLDYCWILSWSCFPTLSREIPREEWPSGRNLESLSLEVWYSSLLPFLVHRGPLGETLCAFEDPGLVRWDSVGSDSHCARLGCSIRSCTDVRDGELAVDEEMRSSRGIPDDTGIRLALSESLRSNSVR